MNTVNTKLTTSGNSKAVRLPKELLRMSGLSEEVELEAKRGQIVIRTPKNPRANWRHKTAKLLALHGDPTTEFANMAAANTDGLEALEWEGPSFEVWRKQPGR